MRKTTFLVGRATGRNTLLLVLASTPGPIVGPFTLRAILSAN